ncbi:MAG: hypothetical protein V1809_14640 [Planctomycetota bacterium]
MTTPFTDLMDVLEDDLPSDTPHPGRSGVWVHRDADQNWVAVTDRGDMIATAPTTQALCIRLKRLWIV